MLGINAKNAKPNNGSIKLGDNKSCALGRRPDNNSRLKALPKNAKLISTGKIPINVAITNFLKFTLKADAAIVTAKNGAIGKSRSANKFVNSWRRKLFSNLSIIEPALAFIPVSYTHLDVYKRQVLIIFQQVSRELSLSFIFQA